MTRRSQGAGQKRRASSPLESSKDKRSNPKSPIDTDKAGIPENLLTFRNTEVDSDSQWAKRYRIELSDADIFYHPEFVEEETAIRWYEELSKLQTWYRPTLKMYGKPYVQSRSIASYATSPDLSARYSGHSVQMNHSYPALLVEIQNAVSTTLGIGFDHVMLNWYQDGSVHIGKHRDTKENQVIASLSLGAPRTFIMHPRVSKGMPKAESESKRWVLGNGSLVVMQGSTQENWKHEIPKEPRIKEGRISLTFRQLVHDH